MTISVLDPVNTLILFDEFDGTNSPQTHFSFAPTGSSLQTNCYFCVWSVDTCVNTDSTFELTVTACDGAGYTPTTTKALSYDPEILTYLKDIIENAADIQAALPGFLEDWPNNKLLVSAWPRMDQPESSWISVASPTVGWRAALIFMHVPDQ